jgi:2,3-bisphosphoglycerate-independent phosphoglycerate mutase
MDGVGLGRGDASDAVAQAHTPTLDALRTLPSWAQLAAHGTAVGMPSDADMGNSEVGHNVLGSGRVVDQGAKLVARALDDGSIFQGKAWREVIEATQRSAEPLHFIGLLSDGNVHSHVDHLFAMIRAAAREGVREVRVHALLDGRDVPAGTAPAYLERLEAVAGEVAPSGCRVRVASGGGRMTTTMDRYEADWSIVERGWNAHVHGQGPRFPSARAAVEALYARHGVDDQNLPEFVVGDAGGPIGVIRDGAAVVLFNFRGDRALEISRAFEDEVFAAFDRKARPRVTFAGMMQYDGDLQLPRRFLVEPPRISGTLSEVLTALGRTQLAISETQKFGHVTYFWNGNRWGRTDERLERWIEVPSSLRPFAERPWMAAAEITDALIDGLSSAPVDFVRVNFANGDMVGHTGDFAATRLAVECVDWCVGRLVQAVRRHRGVLVVTADHGNADHMFDEDEHGVRRARTSHSLHPVPFAIVDPREAAGGPSLQLPARPQLANVTATCLELLGLAPPAEWAPSLLKRE